MFLVFPSYKVLPHKFTTHNWLIQKIFYKAIENKVLYYKILLIKFLKKKIAFIIGYLFYN